MRRVLFAITVLAGCDDYVLETPATVAPDRSDRIVALTGDPVAGGLVFDDHCELCHDKAGIDDSRIGTPLSTTVPGKSVEELVGVVLAGKGVMPAANIDEDQDVADVVAWLQGEWP